MRITFHGAARSVTGTRHLVEVNGTRLLLDCGLVQGRRDEADRRNRDFGFDPGSIDAVVLSHAHIDHSGAIPALVRNGFRGRVHCTGATADLAGFMLRDSGHIQEKDAEFANKRMARRRVHAPAREPLYTVEDADRAMAHFDPHPYHRAFAAAPGVEVTFYDAGHILGSAIVRLEAEESGRRRSVVFTGDLGRPHLPIIRDPEPVPLGEVLILESTYGDRMHPDIGEANDRLAQIVREVVARRGKLIIPAFAVGRTQDIVYALQELIVAKAIPDLPVYIDSPLAVNATEVFRRHPECYDEETREILHGPGDPFGLRRMHYITQVEDSMALNAKPGPFIVISASGMMEAGRILHHLRNSLEDARNAVLIVGFQAERTLGRRILRGDPVVTVFGEPHPVRATVHVMNEFSAHADRDELLGWLRAGDGAPEEVFVVHGEEDQALAFAGHIGRELSANVHVPELHESFSLGGGHGRGRSIAAPRGPAAPPDETAARGDEAGRDAGRSERRSERRARKRGRPFHGRNAPKGP